MRPHPHSSDDAPIRQEAAAWIVRRDRGLNAAERVAYERWLAEDERHAAALQRSGAAWALLGELRESVELGSANSHPPRRRRFQALIPWGGLAAAAAAGLALLVSLSDRTSPAPVVTASSPMPAWVQPQILTLSDGTVVRLNAEAAVEELFTAEIRRVRLLRGEAHFTVTRHATRPFVVDAAGIEARAVGTAYNVKLQQDTVEILVTEGTVAVSGGARSSPEVPGAVSYSAAPHTELPAGGEQVQPPGSFLLTASQRAIVALHEHFGAEAVTIRTLGTDEVAQALAWQEPLLRLSGATLAELAAEFARRTGYQLVLSDPELAALRIGGRFRGDDVQGFLRLLSANYHLSVEPAGDYTIVLRRQVPSGGD